MINNLHAEIRSMQEPIQKQIKKIKNRFEQIQEADE